MPFYNHPNIQYCIVWPAESIASGHKYINKWHVWAVICYWYLLDIKKSNIYTDWCRHACIQCFSVTTSAGRLYWHLPFRAIVTYGCSVKLMFLFWLIHLLGAVCSHVSTWDDLHQPSTKRCNVSLSFCVKKHWEMVRIFFYSSIHWLTPGILYKIFYETVIFVHL